MDNDQSLINLMIEETLKTYTKEERPMDVVSLENYFEKNRRSSNPESKMLFYSVKEKHEIVKHLSLAPELSVNRGIYMNATKAFRFHTHMGLIDVPANWSCFARLNEKVQNKEESVLILDWDNDIHHLIQVFGAHESWIGMMILWMDNELKIVGFKANEGEFLEEIKNLFIPPAAKLKEAA